MVKEWGCVLYIFFFEKNIHNYRDQAGTKIEDEHTPARI